MSQRLTLTLRYVSAAGDGESRWIRLEQEQPATEAVTVEEAAEVMDKLFKINACSQGISGDGGGEVAPADPPKEEYDVIAADFLGPALCAEAEYWTAHVRVYRSHQDGPRPVLRSATARIVATEPDVTESVREIIETPGNSHDLQYPFAGDLVLPPGLSGEVRGSTLNLSRPVDCLVVRYTTIYDRVTLRVPVTAESAQDEEGQALRAALDAAGLIAFWGRLAAAISLEPPERDDSVSVEEMRAWCNPRYNLPDPSGDCWQTVRHYYRCRCSDRDAPDEWTEEVSVKCPEGVRPGRHLGTVDRFGGYRWCEGEEDEELMDPEYYKRVCCVYPPKPLPHCRRTYAEYRGGAEIEGGASQWYDVYGLDARLVPVMPEDGLCGRLIHEWDVDRQNCCDEITPLSPHPDNPTEFYAGESHWICVRDGRSGPLKWRLSGGLIFQGGGTYKENGSHCELISTQDSVCPQPRITVDDGCQPVTMTFSGGGADEPRLETHDMAIGSGVRFGLSVRGGVPPYMWQASGAIEIVSTSADGGSAVFRTPEDRYSWCVAPITVVDQCGQQDDCTIRNADTGRWLGVPSGDFDPCNTPGGSREMEAGSSALPEGTGSRTLAPRGGYRVIIYQSSGTMQGSVQPTCGRGHLLVDDDQGLRDYCARQNQPSARIESSYSTGICDVYQGSSSYNYGRWWSHAVLTVWRWVCN